MYIFPIVTSFKNQSGSIPLTTLISAEPGMYRVHVYIRGSGVTSPLSTVQVTVSFTDDIGAQSMLVPDDYFFTFQKPVSGTAMFLAKSGAISFSTNYSGTGGTYNIDVALERII
jgi:hypothetical protein